MYFKNYKQAKTFITRLSGKNYSFKRLKKQIEAAPEPKEILLMCLHALIEKPTLENIKWDRLKKKFCIYFQEKLSELFQLPEVPGKEQEQIRVAKPDEFFDFWEKMMMQGVVEKTSLDITARVLYQTFHMDYEEITIRGKLAARW